jgi:hypothetical protein
MKSNMFIARLLLLALIVATVTAFRPSFARLQSGHVGALKLSDSAPEIAAPETMAIAPETEAPATETPTDTATETLTDTATETEATETETPAEMVAPVEAPALGNLTHISSPVLLASTRPSMFKCSNSILTFHPMCTGGLDIGQLLNYALLGYIGYLVADSARLLFVGATTTPPPGM